MSDHYAQTIADVQRKLQEAEDEVVRLKQMVNTLCELSGKPAIYSESELNKGDSIGVAVTRPDQFYGKPLATAVRIVLEMRNAAGVGPATVREIYETLLDGGYDFQTKNEQNAMRGLRVSLSKNAVTFHKLPGGQFGLTEWYPTVKAAKAAASSKADSDADEDSVEDEADEAEDSTEQEEHE